MKLTPKITAFIVTLLITVLAAAGLYYEHQSKQPKVELIKTDSIIPVKGEVVDIKKQKYIRGIFKNVTKKSKDFCFKCVFVPYIILDEEGILNTGLETREYEIKNGYIFTLGMPQSEFMIRDNNTIVGVSVETSCCTFKRITEEEFEKELKSK